MTHEPNIPERDPALDVAWREHSTETPSAALDAAILAAAHRAVGSAPKAATRAAAEATSPQRWWMPLAAAATIGAVALGILQTMPQQDSITTPAVSDAPAPARTPERASVAPPASSPQSAPSANRDEMPAASPNQAPPAANEPAAPPVPAAIHAKPAAKVNATSTTDNLAPTQPRMAAALESQGAAAPAPQPFPAEKKAESAESDFKDRARMAPKLATAPLAAADVPPAPPAAAAPMSESARADVRQRNEAQSSAPMATGAVALGKTAARKDAAAVDVDAWIARIRKLHDEGKLADAAKELVAMRAAVPDADGRLPRELRAWAATVKP